MNHAKSVLHRFRHRRDLWYHHPRLLQVASYILDSRKLMPVVSDKDGVFALVPSDWLKQQQIEMGMVKDFPYERNIVVLQHTNQNRN